MSSMEVARSVDELPAALRFVFTLGTFDGVHRGHQRVLHRTVEVAKAHRARPVAMTFEPHPAAVLRGLDPPLLCDPAERLARFAEAGIGLAVVQRFDLEFAAQSAETFLRRLAAGRQIGAIVMTPESAFGHDRDGTLEEVRRLAPELGFEVVEVAQLSAEGRAISSTRLRALLRNGRLADARRLLGRDYAVIGEVVRGDARGRQLGYPTANLHFEREPVLPPDGIYAGRASWGGDDPLRPARRADAVASLGVRPTFPGGARVLEVHLLDVEEQLYGQRLRFEFVRRQRAERRFSSVDSLVRQMDEDAARARRILGRSSQ